MPSSIRTRTALAAVLLACAVVFIAVAVSQWQYGFGLDPRDDLFRRAAGMGFTDGARATLFSIVPVAAPAVAVRLRPGRVMRRLARVVYVAYLVIGLLLAWSAAKYGFDATVQIEHEGQVFIDARAALERLLLDGVWLVLAVVGLMSVRWTGKHEENSSIPSGPSQSPKE